MDLIRGDYITGTSHSKMEHPDNFVAYGSVKKIIYPKDEDIHDYVKDYITSTALITHDENIVNYQSNRWVEQPIDFLMEDMVPRVFLPHLEESKLDISSAQEFERGVCIFVTMIIRSRHNEVFNILKSYLHSRSNELAVWAGNNHATLIPFVVDTTETPDYVSLGLIALPYKKDYEIGPVTSS